MTETEARMIATWQSPIADGKTSEELLVSFDKRRDRRILILPPLFDEANKLRRFIVQTMRALDSRGIDSFLPDLPGCNESLAPIANQSLTSWRGAVKAAVLAMGTTHILSIRGGALLAPASLPGWQYAPMTGAKLLRGMIRARIIASREAGRVETSDILLEEARQRGLRLSGWQMGAVLLRELEEAVPVETELQTVISQKQIGTAGLWLRAEPGEDQTASEALAAIIDCPQGDAA